MKAITDKDICFGTTAVAPYFNTDGIPREHLDPHEVRTALDFNIVKRQSYDGLGRVLPGQFHLVREDTNDIIPVNGGVGARYEPVSHLSVFDYITNKIMPAVPGMELETVGTLHGLGTGLIVTKVGSDYSVAGDDSPNTQRVVFSNPCNGLGSILIGFSNVRLWCQNQIPALIRTVKEDGFAVRHTKNAEFYINNALDTIKLCIAEARAIQAKSKDLASVNIDRAFINRMLDKLVPCKYDPDTRGFTINEERRNEVIGQFESGPTAESIKGDTAWKLFNSFTYGIYNPSKVGKSMDNAQVAYSGMVGTRAQKTMHIFNTIYDEAMRYAA